MPSLPHLFACQHDIYLVSLSFVVSLGASATALRLMMYGAQSAKSKASLLMFGGACGGAGAWATSFIALLSFEPGTAVSYNGWSVFASLVIPVIGGAAGVWATFKVRRPWNVPAWGVIFAAGVGLMNYIGLSALELGGRVLIAPSSLIVSMICCPLISMLAMRLALKARSVIRSAMAATTMATAIFSMHFIMAIGLTLVPSAGHNVPTSAASRSLLADGVAALSAGLVVIAFVCIGVHTRSRQRSYRLLTSIVEAMPQSLAYFDSDDRFVLGNSEYCRELRQLGLEPKAGLHYAHMLERIVDRDHPSFTPAERQTWIAERIAARTALCCDYDLSLADGRYLRSQSKRTVDGGVVTVLSDITSLTRQAQDLAQARDEAEAATRAKSQFLATISHEIRTPLNGVLGMAQAMTADRLPKAQRDRLDVIQRSGSALLNVLNDVLDISKIEAGKLEIEIQEFDLAQPVNAAEEAFRAVADAKGLDFTSKIGASAQGRYRGDAARLRQILGNLISNALKFTEKGSVKLEVSATDNGIVFTVADTGIGMTPDQSRNLFDKFTQADASTTRRFGGTGLGLAICRELASLMSGTISVQSEIGVGSTFTLMLPFECVGQALDETPQCTPSAIASDFDLRVLVAEDNPVNQLVLQTLLGQVGVDPLIVDNGVQAVDAWASGDWDLILMDVQMPQMDGPTAAREIRARELLQHRPRTPIIALTANAMTHQVKEYLDAGMDGFVAKPIETGKLFGEMQRVLINERDSKEDAA